MANMKWNKYPEVKPKDDAWVIVLYEKGYGPECFVYDKKDGFCFQGGCCRESLPGIGDGIQYFMEIDDIPTPSDWIKHD